MAFDVVPDRLKKMGENAIYSFIRFFFLVEILRLIGNYKWVFKQWVDLTLGTILRVCYHGATRLVCIILLFRKDWFPLIAL